MAVQVLYTATRSADFKSLTITDNQTAWTTGGVADKANITAISLYIYGIDKEEVIKSVEFTANEIISFKAGSGVTFQFSDERLWSPAGYAPDNFYVTQLHFTGVDVTESQVAFDSYFYIKKIVMDAISNVSVPIESFYEANRQITGDLAAITQLDYLSSILTIPRESKWRKIYNFLAWNYAI